ncbi:CopD family protein [Mycoavidus sp. B2-EB]|uniref:CopD family protein n=1 Tax=Mycoavidus sp. B2-EB TaxID=2651972 RepID=UPI001629914A|nr:CopD family protein [Mycoavidus sp. B2-EB]BBO60242.1 hypothetical protein MPB2EB_1382 [Mycoavidus sp. B2-EB]
MLWIKSFHLVFVVSWFAGLAYLPRIYMNLAQETEPAAVKRLLLMARKLFRFMTIIAVPALSFGLWLWLVVGIGLEGPGNGWMHAKLSIVALLIAYHITCGKLLAAFEQGRNKRNPCWYRGLSELPVLGLLAVVLLVIFKPF